MDRPAVRRRWRFYRTAGGTTPVRDFLTSAALTADDRDEILAAMKDVQVNGLASARHVHGDIYEVRATGARAAYRVLFATEGAKSQVLLAVSAFSKKTRGRHPARSPQPSAGSPTGGLGLASDNPNMGYPDDEEVPRWLRRTTSTN